MQFTEDEEASLVKAFQDIGVKPKTDTRQHFEAWMVDYLKSTGQIPAEVKQEVNRAAASPEHGGGSHHQFRISTFSGDPNA